MTNKEWFNTLNIELQNKIEKNCNDLNRYAKFNYWIEESDGTDKISGAFCWSNTPEGRDYWKDISDTL